MRGRTTETSTVTFKCQRVIGHRSSVGLSVSGCTGPVADRRVSLGSAHSCIHTPAAAGIIPRPVHFAYVQFGGCDWSILSGWMLVQTSLTGVNTDIAECMNNACAASTVPYQVMRIDFLRWISLIIRCSLDVVVGAELEHARCVWHRTFCAKLYNSARHRDHERLGVGWIFKLIVDCSDFLSLIYSYLAKRTTPHVTFAIYPPLNYSL